MWNIEVGLHAAIDCGGGGCEVAVVPWGGGREDDGVGGHVAVNSRGGGAETAVNLGCSEGDGCEADVLGGVGGGGRTTTSGRGGEGHEDDKSLCYVRDISEKLTDSASYGACLMETNRKVVCSADTGCVCVGEVPKSTRKFKTKIVRKLPLLNIGDNNESENYRKNGSGVLENFKFDRIEIFDQKKEENLKNKEEGPRIKENKWKTPKKCKEDIQKKASQDFFRMLQ